MRVKTGGRTIEIPDERVQRGTAVQPTLAVGMPQLPGWPKPTDKWNYAYAQFLEMEKQAGRIRWWWYEPFSIWLVPPNKQERQRGVRHKVDYMVWENDLSLSMTEVKGHSRNLRDGITRYIIAREMFPCFKWRLVKRERGGWQNY